MMLCCVLSMRWWRLMFNDAMLCFQYALVEADGTPLSGLRRQVTVQRIATTMNGYTRQLPEEKLIVGK